MCLMMMDHLNSTFPANGPEKDPGAQESWAWYANDLGQHNAPHWLSYPKGSSLRTKKVHLTAEEALAMHT